MLCFTDSSDSELHNCCNTGVSSSGRSLPKLTVAAKCARACMCSTATQLWTLMRSTHIISRDACITVLAAILEPAKAHSVTLLQVSHGGT